MLHAQASEPDPWRTQDRFTRLNGEKLTSADALTRFFQRGNFHYQFAGYDNPIRLCADARKLAEIQGMLGKGSIIVRHV
jgi:hypothetical protein